jgi:ribulose-phosphate 3-epimerase
MRRRIAPSILAADFGRLHEQVQSVVDAGAEVVHIDIMDGHFVPTLSMGPPAVAGLRDFDVLLDIHLMIERPERHVQDFAAAGANNITVHYEATPHVHKAVQAIKEAGCTAGVALTPSTPVEALSEIRGELWSVLCMTVNPGWGGQAVHPRLARQDPPPAGARGARCRARSRRRDRRAHRRSVRRSRRDALRGRDIRVRDRGSRGSLPQARLAAGCS